MSTQAVERYYPAATAAAHLHVLGSHDPVTPPASPLIERDVELEVLAGAVSRLAGGDGGVVVLEAPAGLGKTALLEQAMRLAEDAGCLVRHAAPGPLERHFPFGVVRSLLEPPLRDASDAERAQLLDGAAASAGTLLLEGTVPGDDATMTVAHGVLWLCSALGDERPLALVVDDAQWADRSSLEVLSYLARRVTDVPLLIVVGARADDPDAPSDLLSLLTDARSATLLHPQPLSEPAAAELIHRVAPDAPEDVCGDCHRTVGGNPWLLGELARQVAAFGAAAVDQDDPDAPPVTAVARCVVRRRLASLAPRDRAVVAALAVIGDNAAPHVLAAVAEVPVSDLGGARDGLRAAGLLDAAGERFAHSLIAVAISDDLPWTECDRLHHQAARALMRGGAPDDVVASHLLQCSPHGDPEVSGLLVRAATNAAQRGAPHTAAAYLERALSERAAGDDRGRMLSVLASMAFDAGLPDSRHRLREALHEARDRDSRIDVLTRLAALHVVDIGDSGLAEVFERELAGEDDPQTRIAVEAASLDTLMVIPERHEERARRALGIDVDAITDPVLRRTVLAHRAWLGIEKGTPDAAGCAAMAIEALEGDALLREAWKRSAYHLCARALVLSDRPREAREAIMRMRDHAVARGSLRLRAATCWYAAELARRTGRVADAENEARMVFDLVDDDVNMLTGGAVEVLVWALAGRGAFQEAHELLHERGLDGPLGHMIWEIGVRHARAQLWLAEGDYERAYAEATEAGELREQQGRPNPTWTAWRSTASLALSHLGRRAEAARLVDVELRRAEEFGAPVPIVGALHARAVAEPEDQVRVALCERALQAGAGDAAPLQAASVRLELGSTLCRLGRRVEARGALRPALAHADALGAVLLAERARRELVATGLRPRQAAIEGPAALTPRQRQVCELAAAGKGNRAIAQELFLSVKTVETHLAAGYRKLGVNTREALAQELAG